MKQAALLVIVLSATASCSTFVRISSICIARINLHALQAKQIFRRYQAVRKFPKKETNVLKR
jgi:hypothetical protein